MFELFKNHQKCETSSDNCSEKEKNESRDYQILIGENFANASTSQHSLCHSESQNCLSHSQSSSLEGSVNYNKLYRNYTSSPHLFLLVLFLGIYVLLILLGASVFALFEQKAEFQIRDHILRTQQNFLAKHSCVDAESLDSFVESVIEALNNKVNLHQLNQLVKAKQELNHNNPSQSISPPPEAKSIQNQRIKPEKKSYEKVELQHAALPSKQKQNKVKSDELSEKNPENSDVFALSIPTEYSNWEFTSSLLFVTSVVTTIGYGHVTPITIEGKVFCLVFSCVAIPFTLVFLSIIVSLLKNGPVKRFEKFLIKRMTKFPNISEFLIRILHVMIVTLILLLLILILPALYFSSSENWSFLEGIYYCYISLTTVGLGDFVPATADLTQYWSLDLYRIGIVGYLYGGLALIMLWIAVMLRIPQLNLKPFLLTEKEEIDEQSNIMDYTKDNPQNSYGTNFFAQK